MTAALLKEGGNLHQMEGGARAESVRVGGARAEPVHGLLTASVGFEANLAAVLYGCCGLGMYYIDLMEVFLPL